MEKEFQLTLNVFSAKHFKWNKFVLPHLRVVKSD
ncbi:hypothetical protein MCAMS1_02883 [biofilm metagenome]